MNADLDDVVRSMKSTLLRIEDVSCYPNEFWWKILPLWIAELEKARVNLALDEMVEYNQKNGLYEDVK